MHPTLAAVAINLASALVRALAWRTVVVQAIPPPPPRLIDLSSAFFVGIFANGVLPDLEKARRLVKPDDLILCADGGTRHPLALGLAPAVIIGHLNSLSAAARQKAPGAGPPIEPYPRAKKQTDLKLRMEYGLA